MIVATPALLCKTSRQAVVAGDAGARVTKWARHGRAFTRATAISFVIATTWPGSAMAAEWDLRDGALTHPEYRGTVPNKSDVIFSSRSTREEAIPLIKAFGATRVEWVYTNNKVFVDAAKRSAPWFGGAVNATLKIEDESGLARDLDGQPITPPWMKSWGAKSITTTSPVVKDLFNSLAERYVRLGAHSVQVDDPLFQMATTEWGGDFSDSTVAGFRAYLKALPDQDRLRALKITDLEHFDYRTYLKTVHHIATARQYHAKYKKLPTTPLWLNYIQRTVADHFVAFRRKLNSESGKTFPLSMNLGSLKRPDAKNLRFFLTEFVDYAISETPIGDFNEMAVRAATLRALGIGFAPTIKVKSLEENRLAIATLYALGGPTVVPWDVYINNGPDQAPGRYYGKVEEYGDLYAFVRRNPTLFDGLEATAVVGIVVPIGKYDDKATMRLTQRLTEQQVPFAFVLAGDDRAKAAIDVRRASHFKALVTVNPKGDFSAEALLQLKQISTPLLDAAQVTDAAIQAWAPLQAQGEMGHVRLYPTSSPSINAKRMVVHVVDSASAGPRNTARSDCQHRIALRQGFLPRVKISKAVWHSLDQDKDVAVNQTSQGVTITIPQCTLWGALELQIEP